MKKLIYKLRAFCWNSEDAGTFIIVAGIFIISITSLAVCLYHQWVILSLLSGFGAAIGVPVIVEALPVYYRIFKPKSGYILYDNKKEASSREYDRYSNYKGYDDKNIYCVIKRKNGQIFYYNMSDKKLEACDANKFFRDKFIIQIGFDKNIKKLRKLEFWRLCELAKHK